MLKLSFNQFSDVGNMVSIYIINITIYLHIFQLKHKRYLNIKKIKYLIPNLSLHLMLIIKTILPYTT